MNTKFEELTRNNKFVAAVIKSGGTAEDCAVALVEMNDILLKHLMQLSSMLGAWRFHRERNITVAGRKALIQAGKKRAVIPENVRAEILDLWKNLTPVYKKKTERATQILKELIKTNKHLRTDGAPITTRNIKDLAKRDTNE